VRSGRPCSIIETDKATADKDLALACGLGGDVVDAEREPVGYGAGVRRRENAQPIPSRQAPAPLQAGAPCYGSGSQPLRRGHQGLGPPTCCLAGCSSKAELRQEVVSPPSWRTACPVALRCVLSVPAGGSPVKVPVKERAAPGRRLARWEPAPFRSCARHRPDGHPSEGNRSCAPAPGPSAPRRRV
jgi:hypothetical protein